MRHALKEKITVSIDPELMETVDREVRAHHADSRSAIVEEALRLWRVEQRRQAIEQGVEAYYRSQSDTDRQEDRGWTRVAARSARRFWDD